MKLKLQGFNVQWVQNTNDGESFTIRAPWGVPIGIRRAAVGEHQLDAVYSSEDGTKRFKVLVTEWSDYLYKIKRI